MLPLPLVWLRLRLILSHFPTGSLGDLRRMCLNHLKLFSHFPYYMSGFHFLRICSLWILSFLLLSHIHLSIYIQEMLILLPCTFLVAQHSIPHINVGLIIVLKKIPFNLTGIRWLHKTPDALFHFTQPDITYLSIMINRWIFF